MSLSDVSITKLSGGLGRQSPSGDMITGFIANGVAVTGGVQLGRAYYLRSLNDALALLITPEYDTANSVLVYEHIKEYFRVNPNGDMWLMLVAKSVSYANMLDPAQTDNAIKLLNEAGGSIRLLVVAYNPTTAVTDDTALLAAIPKAQELATQAYTAHMPIEVILEGKGYDYEDPIDFRDLNAENVSVMVGQALSVANTSGNATYAAVGTLAGAITRLPVNVSAAWVQQGNVLGGSLQAAAISGVRIENISLGTLNTLNDQGAIYFRTHVGRSGFYLNDSHTATDALSDYAYIEMNRTIHKAVRNIRLALLPLVNSPVVLDPVAGTLSPEVVKRIEKLGGRALEQMLSNQEVSGIDVFVNPAQNILANGELRVAFSIVPTGTARQISVTIGFENPF